MSDRFVTISLLVLCLLGYTFAGTAGTGTTCMNETQRNRPHFQIHSSVSPLVAWGISASNCLSSIVLWWYTCERSTKRSSHVSRKQKSPLVRLYMKKNSASPISRENSRVLDLALLLRQFVKRTCFTALETIKMSTLLCLRSFLLLFMSMFSLLFFTLYVDISFLYLPSSHPSQIILQNLLKKTRNIAKRRQNEASFHWWCGILVQNSFGRVRKEFDDWRRWWWWNSWHWHWWMQLPN